MNPGIQTVYEAIKGIRLDIKSTVIMHNYSRGAGQWLYNERTIDQLRLAWNAATGDEADISRLLDSSPVNDAVDYINSLASKKEKFPGLLSIYLAGLDHWAHSFGLDDKHQNMNYLEFFKQQTDQGPYLGVGEPVYPVPVTGSGGNAEDTYYEGNCRAFRD